MRALVVGGIIALASGCTVTIPEGVFQCTGPEQCPTGWSCALERCVRSAADSGIDATIVDASAGDAGMDARSLDGGRGDASGIADANLDAGSSEEGGVDAGDRDDTGPIDGGAVDASHDGGSDTGIDAARSDSGRSDAGACVWPDAAGGCDDPIQVAAGGNFTCALRTSGETLCWGSNEMLQLGGSTAGSVYSPGLAPMGLGPADEICAGGLHACARIGGRVQCWGANDRGQIGSGAATPMTLAPTTVLSSGVPLEDVVELACGYAITCARLSSGTAVCWGHNEFGQLGDGTNTDRAQAVAVSGLIDVVQLSAAENHACARLSSGQLRCWGINSSGQLGDGSMVSRNVPVVVVTSGATPLADASVVAAAGPSTCALRTSGRVSCWGGNEFGQLGNGTTTGAPRPVTVMDAATGAPLEGGVDLDIGGAAACAIRVDGAVSCWGSAGSVGDGGMDAMPRTRAVTTLTAGGPLLGATSISALHFHVCAIAGNVYCWGAGFGGRLGDGGDSDRLVATPVIAP